jgi:outer membrane immunogenic protein
MRRLIVMGIAVYSGLAVSAGAADLGGEEVPAMYGPANVWAGVYVGVGVGYGQGNVTHTFTTEFSDGFPAIVRRGEDDISGAIYGAHIGYNWQFGDVVAGSKPASTALAWIAPHALPRQVELLRQT